MPLNYKYCSIVRIFEVHNFQVNWKSSSQILKAPEELFKNAVCSHSLRDSNNYFWHESQKFALWRFSGHSNASDIQKSHKKIWCRLIKNDLIQELNCLALPQLRQNSLVKLLSLSVSRKHLLLDFSSCSYPHFWSRLAKRWSALF